MLVGDSHEFIELYRGDKDLRLGKLLCRDHSCRYVVFAANTPSPADQRILGSKWAWKKKLEESRGPVEVEYLRTFLFRFSNENISLGGFFQIIPGYPIAIRRRRPDVMLENMYTTLTPRMYLTAMTAKLLNIPVVYVDVGDIPFKGRFKKALLPFERMALKWGKAFITYNERGRRRLIEDYRLQPEKVRVIPKPIDTSSFSPHRPGGVFRQRFGLGDKRIVMYPGRLDFNKGCQYLLEVAKRFQEVKAYSDVQFVFVGANIVERDKAGFQKLLHGLDTINVTITGFVPPEMMPDAYAAAELVVFPDVTNLPGFSTTLAEAMASGRAVIIGIRGFEDAVPIIHDFSGIVTEARNVSELETVVRALLADDEKRWRLGAAARDFAESRMAWENVAEEYYQILSFAAKGEEAT